MSDIFGIGNAIKTALGMYRVMARRTGRTTNLINSLKPGDRVVVTNSAEKKRLESLCRERGLGDVCFTVCDPTKPENLFNKPPSKGRTIFDHTWVEEFYQNAVERAETSIDYFQRELSGYGEAHIKTKAAYKAYLEGRNDETK